MDREPRFPDIDWYCDHCGAYLNTQKGFDDHKYTWKCTNCGGKNSISRDNIRIPNFKVYDFFLELLNVLRAICVHVVLMMLFLSLFGLFPSNLNNIFSYVAAAYPALMIVTLILMVVARYHGFGIIAALVDMFISDIRRPYKEIFTGSRIMFGARVQKQTGKIILRFFCILLYVATIDRKSVV